MEIEQLTESLNNYKEQISQVSEALKCTPKGDQYEALESLRRDLQELIELTSENIEKLNFSNLPEAPKDDQDDDPFSKEYALFMEEVSKVENEEKTSDEKHEEEEEPNIEASDIQEQLKSLEGTKCAVLFANEWDGKPCLYNAMVCSIQDKNLNANNNFDAIKVRVLFTNPTQIAMIPCPFYLEGDCKFDDDTCKYSHGEDVLLSSLQPANEPDFKTLKLGRNVLAKITTSESCGSKMSEKYMLWYRARVTSINFEEQTCNVKLENDALFKSGGKNDYEAKFSNIFPLNDDASTDTDSESDNSDDFDMPGKSSDYSVLSSTTMLNISTDKLGDWEKHTRGIGSKLMVKMGYIIGTGLGPQNDGRIEPVPCQVLPSGRSLDHCMDLKEKYADEDLFKAEKKLQRLQKKMEQREKLAYERAKEKEEHNVFNILNKTLATQSNSEKSKKKNADLNIKSTSCKTLNIEKFKLDEDMRKIEKDIDKLKSSISRNGGNSLIQKQLTAQLNSKLNDMRELKSRESKISSEQNIRKDKKKMSFF